MSRAGSSPPTTTPAAAPSRSSRPCKDRIDVTVQAFGFNGRFFDELVTRVEAGERPEEHVPSELVFSADEQTTMLAAIRAVPLPADVRRKLEFFAGQFEFVQHGGRRFEYRTKDIVATAGGDVSEVIDANSGADLGRRPRRADPERTLRAGAADPDPVRQGDRPGSAAPRRSRLDDVRRDGAVRAPRQAAAQPAAPAVRGRRHGARATTRPPGCVDLFDTAMQQFVALGLDAADPVGDLLAELGGGLDGLDRLTVSQRLTRIESEVGRISQGREALRPRLRRSGRAEVSPPALLATTSTGWRVR